MNNKILTVVIVLLVVVIGALAVYRPNLVTTIPNMPNTASSTAQTRTFMWKLASAGESTTTSATMTSIALISAGQTYDAGTYLGTCTQVLPGGGVDGKGLLPQEISAVQCWFAGGGDEIGVFNDGGTYVVKHGELGEPDGSATSTGFRGNFTVLPNVTL